MHLIDLLWKILYYYPLKVKNRGRKDCPCPWNDRGWGRDKSEILGTTFVFANRGRTRTSPLKSSNFHGTRISDITESTWQKCVLLPYWIIVRVSLRLGRLSLLPVAGSTNRTNRKLLMATKYFFKISSRHQVSVVMVQIHWTLFGICLIWLIFFIRYESATSMSVTDVGDEMFRPFLSRTFSIFWQ